MCEYSFCACMLYHLYAIFNISLFVCPLFCIRNRLHSTELNAIEDLEERHRRLVELNIIEQCLNVYKTSVVQRRRLDTYFDKETKMSTPRIHPIVFDPQTGIIKSLKDDFEENLRKLKKSHDVFDVSSYTPKK